MSIFRHQMSRMWTAYNMQLAETVLQMNLRVISRGNIHESHGGLPGLSPLRSDGFQGSQAGRLDCMSGGQRWNKGGHQSRIHSDQMVLLMFRWGGWTSKNLPQSSWGEGLIPTQHLYVKLWEGGTWNRQSLQDYRWSLQDLRSSARPSHNDITKQGFQLHILWPVITKKQTVFYRLGRFI
jgi:hypothetical protein